MREKFAELKCLDQSECEKLMADYTATAELLHAEMTLAGVAHPAFPSLPAYPCAMRGKECDIVDVVAALPILEGFVAALRVSQKLGIKVAAVVPPALALPATAPTPKAAPFKVGSNGVAMIDNSCWERVHAEAAIESKRIEAALAKCGVPFSAHQQRWDLKADPMLAAGEMQGRVSSLRRIATQAHIAIAALNVPQPTNGKPMTATQKVLAAKGVSRVEELAQKRQTKSTPGLTSTEKLLAHEGVANLAELKIKRINLRNKRP